MESAALLRSARAASGLTQTEYAALAGVSQPAISAYERGHREPSVSTLVRLVAASGRSLRLDLVWPDADLPRARDFGEHGERLVQVLGLADAIPHRRRADRLAMPRMDSQR